jgi:hypothetical protein
MSLSGTGSDDGNCGNTNNDALHKAICRSVAAGVTYVVAAGNENTDFAASVPAAYDEVLAVTAVADFNGPAAGGGTATRRSDVDDTADSTISRRLAAPTRHTIAAPESAFCRPGRVADITRSGTSGLPACSRHRGGLHCQRRLQPMPG